MDSLVLCAGGTSVVVLMREAGKSYEARCGVFASVLDCGICDVFSGSRRESGRLQHQGGRQRSGQKFEIRPDQGSSLTLVWILENANTCSIRVLMPPEYSVTSISLLGQPANGNVKQISQNLFDYSKNPQYLGTDRFGVKVCGKKSFGTSSCTTVTYQIDSVKK